MQQKVFERMRYAKEVEKKDWNTVLDDLIEMEKEGLIFGFDFQEMKEKYGDKANKRISDRYRQLSKRFESMPAQ